MSLLAKRTNKRQETDNSYRKMKKHIETESEWLLKQAIDIIEYEADALYVEFPFMYRALHPQWVFSENELGLAMATDGDRLVVSSAHIIELFKKNEIYLRRAYLHTILHCLYGHLWLRGNKAVLMYNLACDIAVEKAIDEMDKPSTRRIIGWIRQSLYNELDNKNCISPAQIYHYLLTLDFEYLNKLTAEFFVDDHRLWPKENKERAGVAGNNQAEKKWQIIAHQTQLEKDRNEDSKSQAVERFMSQVKTNREKMTYGDFLMRFARPREEIRINDDELDLGYYSFGLRYLSKKDKQIPLIEPLESTEREHIKAFVIAVDTSASTEGDLVKRFLKETVTLLQEKVFSKDCKIYIIQCDDSVKKVDVIAGSIDIEQFFNSYEILGGGNTDFVPVFEYVELETENGNMSKPEGIVYFTDGQGRYPQKPPQIRSAFVYLEDYDKSLVPPWAIQYSPNKRD